MLKALSLVTFIWQIANLHLLNTNNHLPFSLFGYYYKRLSILDKNIDILCEIYFIQLDG